MKKALTVLMMALLAVSLFISCGEDPFFHHITIMDGDTVVKTETIFGEDGYVLPSEVDGIEGIAGWLYDGKEYEAGERIYPDGDVTITAIKGTIISISLYDDVTTHVILKKGETEFTLPVKPARDGYDFDGWKVDGTVKNPGDKVTYTEGMTISAVWTKLYYITYYNGDTLLKTVNFRAGEDKELDSGKDLTNGELTFAGWSVAKGSKTAEYAGGSSYSEQKDVTLYAVWTQGFEVTFDLNGGTATATIEPQIVSEYASKPAVTPKSSEEYKTFAYWSLDGTNEFIFASTKVTDNIQLKAVYRDYVVGDTGPAGGTIVYIANAAYSEGSVSYGGTTLTWKYIEAAPSVVSVNGVSTFKWCTSEWLATGFNGGVLGTKSNMAGGWYNMQFFKEKGIANFPAAEACDDYGNDTNFDDWYLPSLSELTEAMKNRSIFKTSPQQGHYWSSYSDNDKAKRVWYYALASTGGTDKDDSITGEKLVWPFRAF